MLDILVKLTLFHLLIDQLMICFDGFNTAFLYRPAIERIDVIDLIIESVNFHIIIFLEWLNDHSVDLWPCLSE